MLRIRQYLLLSLLAVLCGLAGAPNSLGASSHPLSFSLYDVPEIVGPQSSVTFGRVRGAGIGTITVNISWQAATPGQEPTNPANPADPRYDWSTSDAILKSVAAGSFQPVVLVSDAPVWARIAPALGVSPPQSAKFGLFLRAAAERYSGKYPGVPRVRFWEIWNEPNIGLFFWPQFDFETKVFTSPAVYRDMVNAAAEAIHAAHSDNLVVAGNTAPFRDITPSVLPLDKDWGPLKFMQRLLCVDNAGRPTCNNKVAFDVWAHHPYTSGGPLHSAQLPYDVSLGDLPKMRATLQAAVRAGHLQSAHPVKFWVTEFSWDSAPPDHCATPMGLLKRWVPESFYRMWANGIELITWFKLMDDPMTSTLFQSGLFFNAPTIGSAKPKPFVEAFRLPFVALRRGTGVYVWAHTPLGKPARVTIQQTFRGGWKKVGVLRTDRFGIVQSVLRAKPLGQFRAVLGSGEKSLAFSMRVPRDRYVSPFGMTVLTPHGNSCSS